MKAISLEKSHSMDKNVDKIINTQKLNLYSLNAIAIKPY